MKTILCFLIFTLAAAFARAQTTNLTALLQQGLFEEQANRNLDAAISDYQTLATQFDKDRQLAATAIFRLGECYRMQGKTNEAATEYKRIVNEFSDQATLATLSQQNLTGMGMVSASAVPSENSDAKILSILKHLPLERAESVMPTLVPDSALTELLRQRGQAETKLAELRVSISTNNPDYQQQEEALKTINQQIVERINGIMEALTMRAGLSQSTAATSAPPDEEAQEIQRIQTMIQNSPDLINASDSSGNTPLAKAAYNGWLKVAAFLLDHGANVNADAGSALFNATIAGNRAMVEFLLAHGANVNINRGGQTPLFTAVQHRFEAVTKVLLDNKADVNGQDSQGNSPLCVAVQHRQTNIIQMLLAAGADVNVENNEGRTPLGFAAESGSPEMVKMLLDAKADPNDGKLDAPLLAAIQAKDTNSTELLLQAGASPNAEGRVNWGVFKNGTTYYGNANPSETPLFLAVATKQFPMVQLLLKYKADPNDSRTDGNPVLFNALDDTNILEALLDAGGKADSRTSYGWPLLDGAVSETNFMAVQMLLQHGANASVRSEPNAENGYTPLHMAALRLADPKIVEFLFDNHADPNVRGGDGKTPLDLLKQAAGNDPNYSPEQRTLAGQLANLLRQHGALDVLPDWDRITVSRPSANFSQAVFQKGTNDWNQFTLLETICGFDQNDNRSDNPLAFADLSRVVLVRPGTNGATAKRIEVNLLNATNGVDCSKDMPLEFGDTVEIPEREHTLAEPAIYLPKDQFMAIFNYLRTKAGEAKLIVKGGETVSLPLQEFYSQIGNVLLGKPAQTVLTSSSDLARVKVIRPGLKTGTANQWILDCSHISHTTSDGRFADPKGGAPDLILRDGDVIEVPEKP